MADQLTHDLVTTEVDDVSVEVTPDWRHPQVDPVDIASLSLRLALGMLIFAQGMGKFGWFGGQGGLKGLEEFLRVLGYDARTPLAWLLTSVEIGSGVLLMAGALTPLAAAGAIGIAVNLTFGLTWSAGYADTGGYGFALLLAAMATAVVFLGPGRFSVDRLIHWRWPMSGMKAGTAALVVGVIVGSFVLTVLGPGFGSKPGFPSSEPAQQSTPQTDVQNGVLAGGDGPLGGPSPAVEEFRSGERGLYGGRNLP